MGYEVGDTVKIKSLDQLISEFEYIDGKHNRGVWSDEGGLFAHEFNLCGKLVTIKELYDHIQLFDSVCGFTIPSEFIQGYESHTTDRSTIHHRLVKLEMGG